jgi:dephospho-CoA kinase
VLGLTGGIGAGKSTVAELLARRGAVVVDTDAIARAVVEPGGAVHEAVVRRFGHADRARLARAVFADARARADLNAIVHPAVGDVVRARLAAEQAAGTAVVVLEVPLLVEAGWADRVDRVAVVDAPEDIAMRRLVDGRGMDEADVRGRMAAQASRAERLAVADVVLDNAGSPDELAAQVDSLWESIARHGVG